MKKSIALLFLIVFVEVRDVLAALFRVQCSLTMFALFYFIVFFRYFFGSFFEMKARFS